MAIEIAKVGQLLMNTDDYQERRLPNEGTVECRDSLNNKFKLEMKKVLRETQTLRASWL